MTYDAKELEQYPEIMNKEQLRKACHISKRTAHYLLKFNLIPHVCTGKKTRCYAIKKRDVIDFMINREINPSRYIVPTSWYKYGNEDVKPYKIRIQPPLPNDPQKTRRYYESKLAAYLDVIDVAATVDFTGYNRHTVCEWIRFGKLRALALQHKYMIPKWKEICQGCFVRTILKSQINTSKYHSYCIVHKNNNRGISAMLSVFESPNSIECIRCKKYMNTCSRKTIHKKGLTNQNEQRILSI